MSEVSKEGIRKEPGAETEHKLRELIVQYEVAFAEDAAEIHDLYHQIRELQERLEAKDQRYARMLNILSRRQALGVLQLDEAPTVSGHEDTVSRQEFSEVQVLEKVLAMVEAGIPVELEEALVGKGWASPETRQQLLSSLASENTNSAKVKREADEARQGRAELETKLKSAQDREQDLAQKLADAAIENARLATEKEEEALKQAEQEKQIATLLASIALLEAQVAEFGGQSKAEPESNEKQDSPPPEPTPKKKVERTGRSAEQFKKFCDALLATNMVERGGKEGRKGISLHGRIETQTTYLERDQSDFNPRNGLLRMINQLYGRTTSVAGRQDMVGETIFGDVEIERSAEIGQAIRLLVESKSALPLTQELIMNTAGAREYWDYSTRTDRFFLGDLPKLMQGSDFSIQKFFLNLPNFIASISNVTQMLRKVNDLGRNDLIQQSFRDFQALENSQLVRELKQLQAAHGEVFTADYMADLEAIDLGEKKAGLVLRETIAKHAEDCNKLSQAVARISALLPLASFQSEMQQKTSIADPHITYSDTGISVTNARNLNRLLLQAALGGEKLSSQKNNWYIYSALRSDLGWPPNVQITQVMDRVIGFENPVSINLTAEKPILLFTGNNGGGKTSAMETAAQAIAYGLTTGANPVGESIKIARLSDVRSLVGASRHTTELSSYQREVTLIADALATLSDKEPDQPAVLIVDEVGKGTDSRDALSLMTAVAEYCRRNNIYLLMATHHGQEFVKLAKELGFRDAMTIVSPDFETHQLQEFEEAVTSKGIEVAQMRVDLHGYKEDSFRQLIANATAVRTAVNAEQQPKLGRIDFPTQTGEKVPFIDTESLADIGMGFGKRSRDEDCDYATLALRNRILRDFGWSEWGPKARIRQSWNSRFLSKQGEVSQLSEPQMAIEHKVMVELVELFKDERLPKSFVNDIGLAFEHALVLFELIDDKARDEMSKKFAEWKSGDLTKTMYFDRSAENTRKEIFAFMSEYGDSAKRAEIFATMRRVGNQLIEMAKTIDAGKFDQIAVIGRRFLGVAQMESFLGDAVENANRSTEELYQQQLYADLAKKLREGLGRTYRPLTDEEMRSCAQSMGRMEEPLQNFFDKIATELEAGNTQTYTGYSKWLSEQRLAQRSSYSSKPVDGIYDESILAYMDDAAKTVARYREKLQKVGLVGESVTEETLLLKLREQISKSDFSFLFLLIRELRSQDVYFEYRKGGKVASIASNFSLEAYFNWAEVVGTPTDQSQDHYAVLGATAAESHDEIKEKFRVLARKYHPDVNKEPNAEDQFKKINDAWTILDKEDKRAMYDRDRGVKAIYDMSYYVTMAKSIADLGWTKPVMAQDASFELRNSLGVSMLAKMGEEQIARQTVKVDDNSDVVVIGGSNGNGKSQLLVQMAEALEWNRLTGFVPAEFAMLPNVNFVSCMINAGESTEGKSSFQSEIDRYLDLIHRYLAAGAPENGIIFIDEPLAGTSSEDQIAILIAMIDFFKQRKVKVIFTNHNYKMYDYLRGTKDVNGQGINFQPVAYLGGKGQARYHLSEFSPEDTNKIRSDGIRAAGELGMPDAFIQIAFYARKALTGTTTADE